MAGSKLLAKHATLFLARHDAEVKRGWGVWGGGGERKGWSASLRSVLLLI